MADSIRRNFDVDDGLKSVQSIKQAKESIKNTKSLCQRGGFWLHRFTSNSREVLNSILKEDRAADTKDHRLVSNDTAIECALSVHWCIESDTLTKLRTQSYTTSPTPVRMATGSVPTSDWLMTRTASMVFW